MSLNRRLSLRTSLHLTIAVMAALSLLAAWLSGSVFARLAVDKQRAQAIEIIGTALRDLRLRLDQDARRRALFLWQQPGFAPALAARQRARLTRQLKELHAQWSALPDAPGLVRLDLYEANREPLARAPHTVAAAPPCADLGQRAAQRQEASAPRMTFSALCVHDGRLFHEALVALGDGAATGVFLHSVTDLRASLAQLEASLKMPVRLSLTDGRELYRSLRWASSEMESDQQFVVRYALHAYTGTKTILNLDAAMDMRDFHQQLEGTRRLVMTVVALITLLAAALASSLLQYMAIRPLATLTEQLVRLRNEHSRLGQRVAVRGHAEIMALADGFNEMSARLKELYESLQQQAFIDPLTGLPNRSLFQDRLNQAILAARREHKPFALLLMDLDRFKDVNDTLGHHIGDALLKQVAQRLRSKLRESDTVARMGGDEFALLLPTVNAKYADMAARMLLQTLRAPFVVEEQSLTLGASIGIALYPDHGVDASVLLQRADVAMYAAKGAGSGYAFYENRLDQQRPTRLARLGELRHALEREEFVLYYQPKVSLREGRAAGIEALVRWRHPQGELLLPEAFILLMEQTGLIRSLTPWVLNEALAMSRRLAEQGLSPAVSVNLSMRDLQDRYLVETVAEQLEANGVSARSLELEITESAVMTDPQRALEVLTRLAEMGLKLSIDDFGTGYSSLAYLKRLPVHAIKIDQSFVTGMTHDEDDAAIVRTSIELAHSLGMEVVAEGVDNEAILKRLRAMGCDIAQGNYLSRPLTAEELELWLRQSAWGSNAGRVPLGHQDEI